MVQHDERDDPEASAPSDPVRRSVRSAHSSLIAGRRVRRLVEHLVALCPPSARVLDVGAGSGAIAAALAEQRPDVSVEGIDVLVRPETAIEVRPYDGKSIPHPDASFDYLLFVDVLHHVDDAMALLREALRVSRRGLIIKDHYADSALAHAILRAMDWVGNAGHGVRLPWRYWSRARWREAFEELGLTPAACRERLGLYRPPVSWICDGKLHFFGRFERDSAPESG